MSEWVEGMVRGLARAARLACVSVCGLCAVWLMCMEERENMGNDGGQVERNEETANTEVKSDEEAKEELVTHAMIVQSARTGNGYAFSFLFSSVMLQGCVIIWCGV